MKTLSECMRGKIINLDAQDNIAGGQYSVDVFGEYLFLVPSKTITKNGALMTVCDYSRKPVKIHADRKVGAK